VVRGGFTDSGLADTRSEGEGAAVVSFPLRADNFTRALRLPSVAISGRKKKQQPPSPDVLPHEAFQPPIFLLFSAARGRLRVRALLSAYVNQQAQVELCSLWYQ
jgi:hypothetical protein